MIFRYIKRSIALLSIWIYYATGASAAPIHDAIMSNEPNAVQSVIKTGADLNQSDYITGTPLHVAVGQSNLNAIVQLLGAGADPNLPGENQGMTPLHLAAFLGELSAAKLLLEGGAKTESVDDANQTPIFAAIKSNNEKLVNLLVEHQADVNADSGSVEGSPLHYAVYLGQSGIARMLAEVGADFQFLDNQQRSLLDKSVSVKSVGTVGDTSLIRWVADNEGGYPAKTLEWRKAKPGVFTNKEMFKEVLQLLEQLSSN